MLTKLIISSLPSVALIGLYFTPVMLFGCVNRGLIAVGIVLGSTIAALITTIVGTRQRSLGKPWQSWLWYTLLLLLPIPLLLGPMR